MDFKNQALGALRRAEGDLRAVVAEAVSSGDYSAVEIVTAWARELARLVAGETGPRENEEGRSQARVTKTARQTARASNSAYPQFYRQGDRLVRVAWSRSDKREYEHRVPRATLTALTEVLVQQGAGGRIFTTDDLLPLKDSEGAEVPSYQVYAVIALLKSAALLDQHGRQGYSIPKLAGLDTAIEAVWQGLPIRKARSQ